MVSSPLRIIYTTFCYAIVAERENRVVGLLCLVHLLALYGWLTYLTHF